MTATIDARQVDPATLVVQANVRKDTKTDKSFVASVKQHGVLVPIIAEEVDGVLNVLDGQLRTLAAAEAGLTSVPVIVVDAHQEAARIIEQIVVNDQRTQLTDADHAGAYKQLALIGISADAIARKTNAPKKRIELAIDVASNPAASGAMAEHQLTLDQAAIVLEFDDNPADVTTLSDAAASGQFDHVASRIRERRQHEAALAEGVASLEAAGVTVVDPPAQDDYSGREPGSRERVERLRDADTKRYFTAETHASCPGNAGYVRVRYAWTENGRTALPAFIYVCTDPVEHGHLAPEKAASTSGPLDDAEKARRKLSRENTKLWAPATEVRLEFIKELLTRRELPAGWIDYVTDFAVHRLGDRSIHHRNFAMHLLQVNAPETLAVWWQAAPSKSGHILLAIAIGSIESEYEYDRKGWERETSKKHLSYLSQWGYSLSELEERVVQGTADKAAI